jgi:hypothetical protein
VATTKNTSVEPAESDDQVLVAPFAVEADHPRNCDLLLQAIPNCRLRSAIEGTRTVTNPITGDVRVPVDQARSLASFPRTPGMQLLVNPMTCEYVVHDPLTEDTNKQMLDRVNQWSRQTQGSTAEMRGVPDQKASLDRDRMKTLCRELINLHKLGHVKVAKGRIPELVDVDDMPGEYLLNPGARVNNLQPRYEKDFPDWVSSMSRQGG